MSSRTKNHPRDRQRRGTDLAGLYGLTEAEASAALAAAAGDIGGGDISRRQYNLWRAEQHRSSGAAGTKAAIPSATSILRLFGSWRSALHAAHQSRRRQKGSW